MLIEQRLCQSSMLAVSLWCCDGVAGASIHRNDKLFCRYRNQKTENNVFFLERTAESRFRRFIRRRESISFLYSLGVDRVIHYHFS
jgi:hypothetical protein